MKWFRLICPFSTNKSQIVVSKLQTRRHRYFPEFSWQIHAREMFICKPKTTNKLQNLRFRSGFADKDLIVCSETTVLRDVSNIFHFSFCVFLGTPWMILQLVYFVSSPVSKRPPPLVEFENIIGRFVGYILCFRVIGWLVSEMVGWLVAWLCHLKMVCKI